MKQSTGKGRRVWFWVGVILLCFSAFIWYVAVTDIIDNPKDAGWSIFTAVLLTVIPTGIGIYGVMRGSKAPAAKPVREAQQSIRDIKDSGPEIVIKMPWWFRGMGWFLLVFGMAWFPLACMVEDRGPALGFIGLGLCSLLVGIWAVGYTTKITFDRPPGYITVTRGQVPVFLWFLRRKLISREEARSVSCRSPERAFEGSGLPEYLYGRLHVVEMELKSGKKIRIGVWSAYEVDHLTRRVLEFSQQ